MKKYFKVEGLGQERRCIYFFLLDDGKIYVRRGDFAGYLNEFIDQVKRVHRGNKYKKEYLLAIELAKLNLTINSYDVTETSFFGN